MEQWARHWKMAEVVAAVHCDWPKVHMNCSARNQPVVVEEEAVHCGWPKVLSQCFATDQH